MISYKIPLVEAILAANAQGPGLLLISILIEDLTAAIVAERDACAEIARDMSAGIGEEIAAKIRSRTPLA